MDSLVERLFPYAIGICCWRLLLCQCHISSPLFCNYGLYWCQLLLVFPHFPPIWWTIIWILDSLDLTLMNFQMPPSKFAILFSSRRDLFHWRYQQMITIALQGRVVEFHTFLWRHKFIICSSIFEVTKIWTICFPRVTSICRISLTGTIGYCRWWMGHNSMLMSLLALALMFLKILGTMKPMIFPWKLQYGLLLFMI